MLLPSPFQAAMAHAKEHREFTIYVHSRTVPISNAEPTIITPYIRELLAQLMTFGTGAFSHSSYGICHQIYREVEDLLERQISLRTASLALFSNKGTCLENINLPLVVLSERAEQEQEQLKATR